MVARKFSTSTRRCSRVAVAACKKTASCTPNNHDR